MAVPTNFYLSPSGNTMIIIYSLFFKKQGGYYPPCQLVEKVIFY